MITRVYLGNLRATPRPVVFGAHFPLLVEITTVVLKREDP
jgi:hypothetical protein